MNDNYSMVQEEVKEPVGETPAAEVSQDEPIELLGPVVTPVTMESGPVPWLGQEEIAELQSRWNSIQTKFVDEPRTSVEEADALVVEALERIEKVLSSKRTILEQQWANHADVSTEDLRTALQSYRSFFKSILAL
jgi:hypothetical protein